MSANRNTAVIFVESPKVETYIRVIRNLTSREVDELYFVFHQDYEDTHKITKLAEINYRVKILTEKDNLEIFIKSIRKKVKVFDVSGTSKLWYGTVLISILSCSNIPIFSSMFDDNGESIYKELTDSKSIKSISKKFDLYEYQKKIFPVLLFISLIVIFVISTDFFTSTSLTNFIVVTTILANLITVILPFFKK